MRTPTIACVLVALGTLAGLHCGSRGPGAGQKITFQKAPQPGKYVMKMTMDMDQDIMADGKEQPRQKITQTMVMNMDVSAPDEKGFQKMEMSFRRIMQTLKVAEQIMSFDSAGAPGEQDPNLARVLRPLLEARIVATRGPDGKLAAVSGVDELWDTMAGDSPDVAPVLKAVRKQMGDNMIVQMMDKARAALPDHPVGVGDEWQNSVKLQSPFAGEGKLLQNCRLDAVEDTPAGKVAVITVSGRALSEKAATAELGQAAVTVRKIDLTQNGQIRYNADVGLVTGQTIVQEGHMSVSAKRPDGKVSQIDIQQRATIKITMQPVKGSTN